jgi:hypothetical protein
MQHSCHGKCIILDNFHMSVQLYSLMTNFQPVQYEVLRAVALRLTIWGVMQRNATQTTSLNRKKDKTLETSYHTTSVSQLRHSNLQFWPGYVLITCIYSLKMLTMEFVGNQGCWDVMPCLWMCGSWHFNGKRCAHLWCVPEWPKKKAIHSFEHLGPLAQ